MIANDANGSGGSAVLKALRATEKPHEKSLSKNKKINDSSIEMNQACSACRRSISALQNSCDASVRSAASLRPAFVKE